MTIPNFAFHKELARNNYKEWMDANRDSDQDVSAAFYEDVGRLLEGIASWVSELTAFKARDWVFRQNRDIRFSANKAPYKTNLPGFFSVGGGDFLAKVII